MTFDLRTLEGIASAEADLAAFEASVEQCVTRDLLPWGLIIGRRQLQLAEARASVTDQEKQK